MNQFFKISSRMVSLFAATSLLAGTAVINIDATKPGPRLNPRMYGIFLEEINHGVDGGLYAELIRNRGFEDAKPPEGFTYRNGRWMAGNYDAGFSRYGYFTNGFPFWSLVKEGTADGGMFLDTNNPLDPATPRSLRLEVHAVASGRIGVANTGYFGIGVTAGKKYNLSFWARGDGFSGPLIASLESETGQAEGKAVKVKGVTGQWKQFKATLLVTNTEANARFILSAGAKGTVWLDMVSLFPAKTFMGRPNGLRPDLAQYLADLKPGFVRFPGGCVIEGGSIQTAFNWKDTVGPLQKRQEQWGPWYQRETHGMGMLEYFQFCQDIGAAPLFVGFAGETCHFRSVKDVPMDQMGWVATNFLDAIQYANGSPSTPWGEIRAAAGHPKPFHLQLVEIGNEGEPRTFPPRYAYVHSLLKAQYPDISYIDDVSFIRPNRPGSVPANTYDIEDDHYYENPNWFFNNVHKYDNRDRSLPPVYNGELAVTSGEGEDPENLRGNLLAALSEGAYLMGLEHNADVVKMVSYAPLLANVHGRTDLPPPPAGWHGMIYFDTLHSFATVSYYLWQQFSLNRPDYTVAANLDYHPNPPPPITGAIGVGTWNDTAEFKDIKIEKDGKIAYESDFTKGDSDWKPESGHWLLVDGAYRQTGGRSGLSYLTDDSGSNYTITLKARKIGSRGEGFLVAFGKKGEDKYWWNVGGYGNTEHGVEFNQSVIGRQVRGRLEPDRWYDVKVVVQGRHIQCFLDGEQIHDLTVPAPDRFFVNAGRDEAGGELVIKAINVSPSPVASTIHLAGLSHFGAQADVVTLSSAHLTDNNSMDDPKAVAPVTTKIKIPGDVFTYQYPANSLTVIKLKAR